MIGRFLPWILLAVLSVVWGSSFILIKRGLEAFTPVEVGALRMAIAGVVLLPLGVASLRYTAARYYPAILLVGLLGNALPAVLFSAAETQLHSSTVGVLNALVPVFTLLIGAVFFRTAINRRQLAGVGIGFTGAILLAMRNGGDGSLLHNLQYGLLIILATIMYAVSTNIIRSKLYELRSVQITSLALPAMGLPALLYLATTDVAERVQTQPDALVSLGYIALLAVFGTAFAVLLFNRLIQIKGPLTATSVTYIIPVVALGWGVVDNEPLGIMHLVGMAAILTGVYIVNTQSGKRQGDG